MKSGKDGEKITAGPMFPRLHVNDTEKGGPRAPPRNKMALYEQLSIPSQRINPGDSRNSRNLHPRDSSSSQGSRVERNRLFHHVSSSPVEKYNASQLEGGSLNAQVAQFEQRKKAGEEDDLRVPVFDTGKLARGMQSNRLIKHRNVNGNAPKRSGASVVESRKEIGEQGEKRSRVCSSREQQMDSVSNSSTRQKIDRPLNESEPSTSGDCRDQPASRSSGSDRLHSSNDCSRSMIETKDNGGHAGFESVRDSDNNDLAQPISGSRSMEDLSSPCEPINDIESRGVEMRGSQQIGSGDKSDDVSETSMVDSGSAMDISPDDVVGVIGQKRFWKARRAILNQQRAFGVQVFELHRLIKVQRLIAGSPHLLLEDAAYLAKPSSNGSTPEKLTLECAIKPVVQIKCKDDSGKLTHKFECSAENAVGRASLSSAKNGNQPSNYGSYPGNQPQTSMPTYNNTNPWFFHQSPMHQWLIPVMTPSEGLVYKPYPGPGFAGTAWGGCGSFGSPPMTPAYGVASPPPHYQGMGFLPGVPSGGQAYFLPYGMPVMNPAMSGSAVEQMNQFAEPGSHGQADPLSGEGANFKAQQQNSPNLAEKNGANSQIIKSKVPEIQGTTASSPSEKVQEDRGVSNATKGSNALPLFPAAKAAPQDAASQPHDTDQPTRVIRVVPHNSRSANESAARIFQSIQEERRHQDSA